MFCLVNLQERKRANEVSQLPALELSPTLVLWVDVFGCRAFSLSAHHSHMIRTLWSCLSYIIVMEACRQLGLCME